MTMLLRRKGLLPSECVVDKDWNHCSLTTAKSILSPAACRDLTALHGKGASPANCCCLLYGGIIYVSSSISLKGPALPLRVWCSTEGAQPWEGMGAFQGWWELHNQHFPPCSSPGWAVLIAAGLCSVVGAFCWELLRQRSELLPLTGIRALFRLQEAKNPLEKPSGLHYLLKLEKQLARVINTWVASVNPAKAALLSQWLQAQINCFWDQEHIYKCDWSSWQC